MEKNAQPSGPREQVDEVLNCAICLNDILPDQKASLQNCNHKYCVECILKHAEEY